MRGILWSGKNTSGLYRILKLIFAGKATNEEVITRAQFNASPEAVWDHIMFYEETSERSPLLLRALLTAPIRTEGDKRRAGANVRCVYKTGHLIKRISAVERPSILQFEIVEQHLGIEGCVLAIGGSYQLHASEHATELMLLTRYRAYLHPRFVWRPAEAFFVAQLHNHILRGLTAILTTNTSAQPIVAESLAP